MTSDTDAIYGGTNISAEERTRLYETQTTALYAGLGEFVARFEMLVHNMRTQLLFLMTSTGLAQTLVTPAYAELTAAPLQSVFLATFSTAIRQSTAHDDAEKKVGQAILEAVCKRVKSMIELRNEIVHGTWFIGWASVDQTDFNEAYGFKPKNTKVGVKHNEISRSREDFDQLIDQCNELYELINRFAVVRMGRRFTTNFVWQDGQASLLPEHRSIPRKRP